MRVFVYRHVIALGCFCLAAIGLIQPSIPAQEVPTRVACVGDSITAGARVDAETQSYPAQLQQLLGDQYEVKNFGTGGATLIKTGRPNVWQKLTAVKKFQPQIVVVSLGTNDTVGGNRKNWEQNGRFEQDYLELIDELTQLSTKPRIVICTPTAMVLETSGLTDERRTNLTERQPRLQELCQRIRKLAADNAHRNVELLELNQVLKEHPQWLTEGDGVHPNQEGYAAIARAVADQIRPPPEPPMPPNRSQEDAVAVNINSVPRFLKAGTVTERQANGLIPE